MLCADIGTWKGGARLQMPPQLRLSSDCSRLEVFMLIGRWVLRRKWLHTLPAASGDNHCRGRISVQIAISSYCTLF